jgi:hypothetical protein
LIRTALRLQRSSYESSLQTFKEHEDEASQLNRLGAG